ncbi:MAG: L-histidine N(alpha)-methyltransferase [Pseudomonadota bacterium]
MTAVADNRPANETTDQRAAFRDDVLNGLSAKQKFIPSRWLYDDRGSELFEEITTLPEYYPTRTEAAILTNSAPEIAAFCGEDAVIIEYGAGASVKTEILLNSLTAPRLYVPMDIAGDFLEFAAARLRKRFPTLAVQPVVADFTTDFDLPDGLPKENPRIGFFPGSTIGNLDITEAASFLRRVARHVSAPGAKQGRALIGIDLKKSTDVLIPAYDDAAGVTAAFNRNLLTRINRELGGTFELALFRHEARWNAQASAIEMHLVSQDAHVVSVSGTRFSFDRGETIHTESSRKYSVEGFSQIAMEAGWTTDKVWSDALDHFALIGLHAR